MVIRLMLLHLYYYISTTTPGYPVEDVNVFGTLLRKLHIGLPILPTCATEPLFACDVSQVQNIRLQSIVSLIYNILFKPNVRSIIAHSVDTPKTIYSLCLKR